MTPEQRQQIENQIKNDFVELQKKLVDLKAEIQNETDEAKKQEKSEEIKNLESEAEELKIKIDALVDLHEQDLQSLKTRLESFKAAIQNFKWEVIDLQNEKSPTPTTYELLKDSETCNRLRTIISSNPNEFKNIPWDTAEKKLEYIFTKIRNSIVLFMKNKLWDSEKYNQVISNTIAPAFEWSLMELLRDQWNETNVSMLQWIDKISWDSFGKLVRWVSRFAGKAAWSYSKFNQWMNAVDYLSVHNWVLNNPEKSEVLTNPLKFQAYINNQKFAESNFSPYTLIEWNIFEISDEENFEFWMSLQEKQAVLAEIWQIQVVNSPKTTALIAKMIDKPEQFLQKTQWLQETANGLLDSVKSLNSVTKMFWVDILWEITKAPEHRSFLFKIMDFVCKLIWITWGLEWIVKRWRLDRMNLTDAKNNDISKIFEDYKESAWENTSLNITDDTSCKAALNDFAVTNPTNASSTKGDFLRDSIADNMDVSLISPAIVQQILWTSYVKKETVTEKWKSKEIFVVDESKITEADKLKLAHNHLVNMKTHLEVYKNDQMWIDLSEFYKNIHSTEDIALCITASLYADKDDVIEWVKARVFLPENYWVVRIDWTVNTWNNVNENWNENHNVALSELTTDERTEIQSLVEQSKTPNSINYLENRVYKKYLNIIENGLGLPKYSLECVCSQESTWKLYNWNNIIWSNKWAQWLFQFMPSTADSYMKHSKLQEKYWKVFSSRDEFLKDPLATARAAWIMYSELMNKHNYNFQTSLACYNRGIGNYQKGVGDKNLESEDMANLPKETKQYVERISRNILEHNWVTSSDVLLADLWQYSRNGGNVEWRVLA